MDHLAALQTLIAGDPDRLAALRLVAALGLPDCWIGAGFVRDAVWDDAHGRGLAMPVADVDVIWFDAGRAEEDVDRAIERRLRQQAPDLAWSVKNQARMHLRNRDAPYRSVADAMTHWPETATAVAARLCADGSVEINAPFGLDDLFGLVIRPTWAFVTSKRSIFDERVATKRWRERYPRLTVVPG